MNRRQAREEAFILIFEKHFNSLGVDEILEIADEVRDLKPDDYIKSVFTGVYDNLEMLDNTISENSIGWKINRISKTSLCILRLAIYEIKLWMIFRFRFRLTKRLNSLKSIPHLKMHLL
jgi:N utilization substance protein B